MRSVTLHYFFGDPHSTSTRATSRRETDAGYRVIMPKYEAFGIGWEAFGALGWETNAKTDTDSIDRYLQLGYPLRWVVIGSGFWPAQPDSMHETTSFGLWDHDKYPDPRGHGAALQRREADSHARPAHHLHHHRARTRGRASRRAYFLKDADRALPWPTPAAGRRCPTTC